MPTAPAVRTACTRPAFASRRGRRWMLAGMTACSCLGFPGFASAQVVRAGAGSVSAALDLRLTIPTRLHARQLGPAEVAPRARGARFTEVAVPVEAAANVEWTLAIAVGEPGAAHGLVEVLCEDGDWRALSVRAAGSPVVVARGAPTNPRPIVVRLRLADDTDVSRLGALRLLMQVD